MESHELRIPLRSPLPDPSARGAAGEAVWSVLGAMVQRTLGSEEGANLWASFVERDRALRPAHDAGALVFSAPDGGGARRTEARAVAHWLRLAAAAQQRRIDAALSRFGTASAAANPRALAEELSLAGRAPFVELRRSLWEIDAAQGRVIHASAHGAWAMSFGELGPTEASAVRELLEERRCGCDTCAMLRPSAAFETSMRHHFQTDGPPAGRASAAWYLSLMAEPSESVAHVLLGADEGLTEHAAQAMTDLAPRRPGWRAILEAAVAAARSEASVGIARRGLDAMPSSAAEAAPGPEAAPEPPRASAGAAPPDAPPEAASSPPSQVQPAAQPVAPPEAKERLIERARRWLVADAWPITKETESSLHTGAAGKNGISSVVLYAREAYDQLVCYALPGILVPEALRPAVMELITRVNYGMVVGCFELDLSDGEVRFRTSIDAEGMDEIPDATLRALVRCAVHTLDRYRPWVEAVAEGRAPAKEAARLADAGASPPSREAPDPVDEAFAAIDRLFRQRTLDAATIARELRIPPLTPRDDSNVIFGPSNTVESRPEVGPLAEVTFTPHEDDPSRFYVSVTLRDPLPEGRRRTDDLWVPPGGMKPPSEPGSMPAPGQPAAALERWKREAFAHYDVEGARVTASLVDRKLVRVGLDRFRRD